MNILPEKFDFQARSRIKTEGCGWVLLAVGESPRRRLWLLE